MPPALCHPFLSATISKTDKENAVTGEDRLAPRKAVNGDSGRHTNKMKRPKTKWQPKYFAAEAKLKTRKGGYSPVDDDGV